MKRRELLKSSAAFGLISAIPFSRSTIADTAASPAANPLKPPTQGSIPVAFLVSQGAVVIDFAGPWEVFGNAMIPGRMEAPFRLYTVSEAIKPFRAAGGMQIIPDYSIENAPAPKVIVIPAQEDPSEAVLQWIRKSSKEADVTMSVCTGAYILAQTGLLAGKAATTHHASYVDLATKFPNVRVVRGVRFVEDGNLASSGGLSCGIDLAFRVVERYYGREFAKQTAFDMEYQGQGWMNRESNAVYAKARTSSNNHPLCAVCSMAVDVASSPSTVYKGATYYFCSPDHKSQFDAAPTKFIS